MGSRYTKFDVPSGLCKIAPHRKDYSLIHTFGAFPVNGLPDQFSIYDGRIIPDQRYDDTRFEPPVRPLPMGCTGESQTFDAGIQDGAVYRPDDFYDHTPPGRDGEGRDMRASLDTAKSYGFRSDLATEPTGKRVAYFNCYGSGKIDDTDAVRIALWINQHEKRSVSVGSWWYPEFMDTKSTMPVPSFRTSEGSLHNYIITGWRTRNGEVELEVIPWLGMFWGKKGLGYMPRPIFNALMAQPWTGAFTMTKMPGETPIPVGVQAYIDHLVYFIRNLFNL